MLKILINVSPFDSNNANMVQTKNSAELLPDYWKMAHACDEMFYQPAMRFWTERFGGRNDMKIQQHSPHPMWGVFAGNSEPSVCVELEVEQSALTEVKLTTIDFGERFKQENVHITRSLGHDTNQPFAGLLDEHGTLEVAWLVEFNTLLLPREIKGMATDAGIQNLSIKTVGQNLLVYTCGNPNGGLPVIPDAFNRLAQMLGKTDPIVIGKRQFSIDQQRNMKIRSENVWCMELTNYGNPDYKATHTYAEARRQLNAR